jgi:hypothetical protein
MSKLNKQIFTIFRARLKIGVVNTGGRIVMIRPLVNGVEQFIISKA